MWSVRNSWRARASALLPGAVGHRFVSCSGEHWGLLGEAQGVLPQCGAFSALNCLSRADTVWFSGLDSAFPSFASESCFL